MKVNLKQAYVLHRRAYTESSLLVEVFTRDFGRLTVLAKGGRRLKSPLRGVLLPFKPLLLSWSGKGQLPIATHAENIRHVSELSGATLTAGFYLNELIIKLLERYDAHEALFDAYDLALLQLVEGQAIDATLRIFEKALLKEIGFGLILDHDVKTGEIIDQQNSYHYYPESGPTRAERADERVLTVSGNTLIAIQQERLDNQKILSEAKRLTRTLIDHQLRGRQLRSRAIAYSMHQFTKS